MTNGHPSRATRALLACVAAVALTAGACGGGGSGSADESATPRPGGTLNYGTPQAWNLIDPLRSFGDAELTISEAVYDQLLVRSPDGEVEPALVESYDVSQDRLSYTLHLREGVVFHDGTPFNAEAVRINLERVADPANGCFCSTRFDLMRTIETPDESTVVIRMRQPDASFLGSALVGPQAGIVSPAALEEHGDDVGQRPVGTGPFEFVSQTAGAELIVRRFDQYWRSDRPYLDEIIFRPMTDPDTRFASLQSGAIDVAEGLQAIHVQQAENDERVNISTTRGYGTTFVQFNVSQPPFNDVTARRAVCAATDREAINQAVNFGLPETDVNSPFPPSHPYFPGSDVPGAVAYDPGQARRMVSQLGGLRFTLSVGSAGARVAEALQAQWREVGMDVQVETLEITALARKSTGLLYDGMYINMFGTDDPNIVPAGLYGSESPGNVTGLADDELDRLIAEGRSTANPEQRQDIYRQVDARLAELTPVCYLWATDYYLGTAPNVHGIQQRPDGRLSLTDAFLAE